MTKNSFDAASDLDRTGVYRLNIGIRRSTYLSLFPQENDQSPNFTALDEVMPHPVYGSMFWICVLNPSVDTFRSTVQPLLEEAYQKATPKTADS